MEIMIEHFGKQRMITLFINEKKLLYIKWVYDKSTVSIKTKEDVGLTAFRTYLRAYENEKGYVIYDSREE